MAAQIDPQAVVRANDAPDRGEALITEPKILFLVNPRPASTRISPTRLGRFFWRNDVPPASAFCIPRTTCEKWRRCLIAYLSATRKNRRRRDGARHRQPFWAADLEEVFLKLAREQ